MMTTALKTDRGKGHNALKFNEKAATFVVCLFLSGFLWIMNSLGKKYTDTLPFQLQYLHLSKDKKLLPVTNWVSIKMITSGYNLLAYNLGIKELLINVDAASFRHKENQYLYTLQTPTHQDKIREQLGAQTELVDIAPDTLFLRPGSTP